jgi:hypothetical protein
MFGSLIGAPISIVQGYCKSVQVNVPWLKLTSKPVLLRLEDIHIVLSCTSAYDRAFVKQSLLNVKRQRVQELLI